VVQRTYAWFTAIESYRLLQDQLARLQAWNNGWFTRLLTTPPRSEDQWRLIATIAEGGYYSVWLKVFKAHSVNHATTLAQTLNARATATNLFRYKGTNLVNSVTNLIPNL
jgi:hypothetical protein